MAKNYTELEMDKTNNKDQAAKDKLISLIMEKVDNGSNIDYIVKLSEIYRNIK